MVDGNYRKLLVSFLALTMATRPAMATPASKLSDLIGARGSSGEMALESRGFPTSPAMKANTARSTAIGGNRSIRAASMW